MDNIRNPTHAETILESMLKVILLLISDAS